jgi:hypothetical protein
MAYIVKDIAARNAIPAGDRTDGMAVRVLDTGGTFHLRGGTTNAYWVGPFEWGTSADTEIYVNGSTGNDTTGTGAVGAPYATIDRAYRDVPYTLRHSVQIRIAAGTYTSFPNVMNKYEGDGQLSFDGDAEISDDEGTLTVNTATRLGSTNMYDINVSGASWGANEHQDKVIKILTGASTGAYAAVWSNTTDTMRVFFPTSVSMSAADTYIVGEPQVTVNLPDERKIEAIDLNYVSSLDGAGLSRIGLGFINFNATNNVIRVSNTNIIIASCVFASSNDNKHLLLINNSNLNYNTCPTPTEMFTKATVGAYGGQLGIAKKSFANQKVIANNSCYIIGFVSRAFLSVAISNAAVYLTAFGRVNTMQGHFNASSSYFGVSGDDSLQFWVGSTGRIVACYFGEGTYCIEASSSKIYIVDITGGSYTQYAVRIAAGAIINISAALAVTAAGGDIYWDQTTTGASEPASGAAITDSQGAWYIRN